MGNGFATRSGQVTTPGRGASDYSATVPGHALGADAVWVWTDVDRVMSTDPQVALDCDVEKGMATGIGRVRECKCSITNSFCSGTTPCAAQREERC